MNHRTPALRTPAPRRPAGRPVARRPLLRLGLAGVAGTLLALAAPLGASAHVTVDPVSATAGSYTILTVKVPNESATAKTAKVELRLPTDTPFASVSYVPVPGWTAELVESTLPEPVDIGGSEITEAITSVVWTADPGSEIADGQLQQFALSVGPVPDTGSVTLPAIQTYTDGEVVEWIDAPDGEEPAPVVAIGDAPVEGHGAGTATATSGGDGAAATDGGATSSPGGDDVLARVLGVGGLVVGAVGIGLAVSARRRNAVG